MTLSKKIITVLAILALSTAAVYAAWYDTKSSGDIVTEVDWNAMTAAAWRGSTDIYRSSGNVGIGTTSPGASLDVITTTDTYGTIRSKSSTDMANSDAVTQLSVTDDTPMAAGVGGAINFRGAYTDAGNLIGMAVIKVAKQTGTTGDPGGRLEFYTLPTTGVAHATNGPRMVIDKDGNVGIGTTSPGAKLEVLGSDRISSSTNEFVHRAVISITGGTTLDWTTKQTIALNATSGNYSTGVVKVRIIGNDTGMAYAREDYHYWYFFNGAITVANNIATPLNAYSGAQYWNSRLLVSGNNVLVQVTFTRAAGSAAATMYSEVQTGGAYNPTYTVTP